MNAANDLEINLNEHKWTSERPLKSKTMVKHQE